MESHEVEGSTAKYASKPRSGKIRRIENVSNRQVTFSKRRTGLLKKAYELSVLCDVHVAAIVFSSSGRLSEFASPSMAKVLEKYHESSGTTQRNGHSFQNLEYWRHEAILMKKQIDFLQMQQSVLMGENLTSFQLKDLEILESKLCFAMDRVKEQKMELFHLCAQEMCKKENLLLKENSMLRLKLADVESRRDISTKFIADSNTCCGAACDNNCRVTDFLKLGLNS